MQINLPKKDTQTGLSHIQTESNSLVVLGANGSGKSRLGSWLENYSEYQNQIHRISAQKSLIFPKFAEFKPLSKAELGFKIGVHDKHWLNQVEVNDQNLTYYRKDNKWKSNVNTSLVDDYQALFDLLFSSEEQQRSKYFEDSKVSEHKIAIPLTLLTRLKNIWEKLLPTKELIIESQNISTKIKGTDITYSATEMSDGERVLFYLIGQTLCVPDNSTIVIDEPELHIHKSLQNRLWKTIEQERNDCNFIYLTHDIDFVSNHSSDVLWMKSYDGMQWDWEILENIEYLPKELIYEIVGSRQPILFTEGTKGSFDYQLFTLLFPDYLIKPLGSCTQVIQTVKSIKNISQLNGLDIYGIIDRDRRSEHEIQAYEEDRIYTLRVAEIENLFIVPEAITKVCELLGLDQAAEQIQAKLFNRLQGELSAQVMDRVRSEISFSLQTINLKMAKNIDQLGEVLNSINTLNAQEQYSNIENIFNQIIQKNNYRELLAFYNRKSLLQTVAKELGLQENVYIRQVLRGLNEETFREIYLSSYIPNFTESKS